MRNIASWLSVLAFVCVALFIAFVYPGLFVARVYISPDGLLHLVRDDCLAIEQRMRLDRAQGVSRVSSRVDPWGRPYSVLVDEERRRLVIYSLGRDGAAGGTCEDADYVHSADYK